MKKPPLFLQQIQNATSNIVKIEKNILQANRLPADIETFVVNF